MNSINILLNKLDEKSEFMETDGTKLSKLINVSEKNLFVLGSAYNSTLMNTETASLFESKVIKQSPTEDFAESCTQLRQAIINSLRSLSPKERPAFKTMSDWMEMSGVIWDIIVKYQDIVKHRNVEEMKCYNILQGEITRLIKINMENHIQKMVEEKDKLIKEIEEIETTFKQNITLEKAMDEFDKKV